MVTIYFCFKSFHCLRTISSVSLSKVADLVNLIVNLGLIPLLPSLWTLSELSLLIVANPFLVRIWESLATSEIHYPIPSICTVPCFFMMTLHKNNPWLSLDSLRTLKTSVSLNLGFSFWSILFNSVCVRDWLIFI